VTTPRVALSLRSTLGVSRFDDRPTGRRTRVNAEANQRGLFGLQPPRQQHGARALCEMFQVRVPCLHFAMADLELVGAWGGMSATDRRWCGRRVANRVRPLASCTMGSVRPRTSEVMGRWASLLIQPPSEEP
jgi:hypothetical protein